MNIYVYLESFEIVLTLIFSDFLRFILEPKRCTSRTTLSLILIKVGLESNPYSSKKNGLSNFLFRPLFDKLR